MPVKRREPKQRITGLSETALAFFLDQPPPENYGRWELLSLRFDDTPTRKLWDEHRDEILREFIQAHPGRRPESWWRFDAPEDRRRRLGGVGTSKEDAYAGGWIDSSTNGLPDSWCDEDDPGVPIDWNDPPRYESQPSFLARHGLLSPVENKKLSPADFEPELVKPDADE